MSDLNPADDHEPDQNRAVAYEHEGLSYPNLWTYEAARDFGDTSGALNAPAPAGAVNDAGLEDSLEVTHTEG